MGLLLLDTTSEFSLESVTEQHPAPVQLIHNWVSGSPRNQPSGAGDVLGYVGGKMRRGGGQAKQKSYRKSLGPSPAGPLKKTFQSSPNERQSWAVILWHL